MLRKKGNMYVLDVLVKVPSRQSSTRRENKGSESRLSQASQLSDGRKSERGRQVQVNRNRKSTT